MTAAYEPWSAERAAEIIAAHKLHDGPTLIILHALQDAFGHVPELAVARGGSRRRHLLS